MTLTISYNGAPIGYDVPPTKVAMPNRAELGAISMGSISPEDPTAALTLVGHKPIAITESACSQPRLFTGWTVERSMGRSFEQSQFVGADPLIHDTTIVDLNAALGFRIITWTDGKRPEESVDDRLKWLLASNYVAGPDGTLFEDTGFVHTGFSLLMDECDYRGSYPADVLADMSTRYATVINYFVFWDPAPTKGGGTPRPGLFWNYIGAATFDCTISISNDIADTYAGGTPSATCVAPITESRLERTPESVYSDVIVNYANGSCYRINAATATAFVKRGTSISRPHIGKLSTAQAAGDAFLAAHAAETDRITTTIHVPASAVGLIQAGMRMQVKFTHLTDYTAFTWMRIVACTPRAMDDLARYYDVDLELVSPHAGPVSLHQVVLASNVNAHTAFYGGFYLQPNGGAPATMVWGGVGSANLPLTGLAVPTVMQDTDGYSGTPGDWQSIGTISSVTIPTGLGGTYTATVEGMTGGTAWWPAPGGHPEGRPPSPHAVQYVFGGVNDYGCSPGDGLPLSGWTVTYDVRANGVVLASHDVTGPGGFTQDVPLVWQFSGLTLSDGDVVTLTATWHDSWGVANFGNSMGMSEPATRFAIFALTMTGMGGTTGGIVPTVHPTIAATAPTVTDDNAHGYATGSTWFDTSTGTSYLLTDDTAGAAVWAVTGTGGAVTTITTQDEGSTLSSAVTTIDFVGAGVTASGAGATTTVTIPGATGAPTTADYLVGTADAGLSAEIVVGTTPGGELGGMWASPTVDTIHSGSAHLALGSTGSTAAPGNHTHAAATGGELLISDTPSTPLVFGDILQNDAENDFLYTG